MNTRTILIADDESHILHVVSLKLSNAGFAVLTARDGREALELARHEHPDLIITDYHMPHLSGLELCAALRNDPATRDIPAILLTARGYSLEPQDTEDYGIRCMIAKPFSPRQLLQTVNETLGITLQQAA
jgi:two-component system, OmpR family, alkaline phosphatase synthesis response regulator PhoP